MTQAEGTGSSDAGASSYLPTLDGWRAVAIGLVLVDHGADALITAARHVHLDLARLLDANLRMIIGLFGVHIFFGLSGFLITTRLMDEERKTKTVSLKKFYLRRLFRIQPPALAFLLVVGALGWARVIPVHRGSWLSAMLCFANLTSVPHTWYTGHFWSLAVEEHFYLLWPMLFLVLGSRARIAGALAFALGLALWRSVAFKYHLTFSESNVAQFWGRTDIQAEGLMWGCLAALVGKRASLRAWVDWLCTRKMFWLWLGVLLASVFVHSRDWKTNFLLKTVAAALIPLVLLGTVRHPTLWVGRILESSVLRWVGRISYSLYLWQQVFFAWDAERAPALGVLQTWPLNLACALLLAAASHYFLEKPVIALGRRLVSRRKPQPSAVVELSLTEAPQRGI
jgi:peptidoglycan/LPS O-acetylase OafA/YrhL